MNPARGWPNRIGDVFEKGDDIVVRITTDDACHFDDDNTGNGTRGQPDELDVARSAIRLHGGGVSVWGKAGKRFGVTVTLPVISSKEHSNAEDIHEKAFGSCG